MTITPTIKRFLGISMAFLLLVGCSGKPALKVADETEKASGPVDTKVVQGHNRFALGMLELLDGKASPGKGNLFFSPLSISLALSMTLQGAAGETKEEMLQALQMKGITLDELNATNGGLRQSLLSTGEDKVQFTLANSMWLREGVKLGEPFLQANERFYDAKAAELNFGRKDAASRINKWVEEKTKGKIKNMVSPPIDSNIFLILINTIYFKGQWSSPFRPEQTAERDFHLVGGSPKKHPMMVQGGRFDYVKKVGYQAVRLPYGDKGRFGMIVVLPDESSSLDALVKKLAADSGQEWLNGFTNTQGKVTLPKWKQEYEAGLNESLHAMGMKKAFVTGVADFSGMLQTPRGDEHISRVKHKAYIEVQEQGTEAAAATAIMMAGSSAPLHPFEFTANRPFLYAIHDRETGSLLFLGTVRDPKL